MIGSPRVSPTEIREKKNEEKGKTVEIIFLNQSIRVSLTDFHPIATESFHDLSAIKTYLVFNYDHV